MKFLWEDVRDETWELFHVGMIVEDLEQALAFYRSLDLVTSVAVGVDGKLARHSYEDFGEPRDRAVYSKQKIGVIRLGGLPVELVEVPAEGRCANAEFWRSRGEGISHIAFLVDDLEKETANLVGKGIGIVLTEWTEGRATMRYFDTRERGGLLLELKQKGTM